jgi:hypothetical protein
MLKLNPEPQFSAEIEITVPGKEEMESITLVFKYRTLKELTDFFEKCKSKDFKDIFHDMIVNWSGIDAEFNKKNVDAFINNYPAAGMEIFREYARLSQESRIKN